MRRIPVSKVAFSRKVIKDVSRVLKSGLIAQGPKVAEFETMFSEKYKIRNVIAVNNGTTALFAALVAHGVGEGDEVITSPFTFAATLNSILAVGARPVFADIEESDFNMSVGMIERLITSRTKAIMPVHLYGQMCEMAEINRIAEKHELIVIEDAAQAQGATHYGVTAGSRNTATFSLYATKNMTTGEGGLIGTDDDVIASKIRTLRNQGMRAKYDYVDSGFNWRLTDLQAAIGIPQLEKYQEIVKKRKANADFYNSALSGLNGVVLPTTNQQSGHVWHQYTIRVTKGCAITRDQLVSDLDSMGIGTGIYYPRAVYDYEVFRRHELIENPECPVAERVANEVVSIPIHQFLKSGELKYISESIVRLVK